MRTVDVVKLIRDGVMTGTAVVNGSSMDVTDVSAFSFHFVWSGTPSGSFRIEASNDGTNFVDMGITIADAAGAMDLGGRLVDITKSAVAFVRPAYTNAASTGVLQCYFCGKEN